MTDEFTHADYHRHMTRIKRLTYSLGCIDGDDPLAVPDQVVGDWIADALDDELLIDYPPRYDYVRALWAVHLGKSITSLGRDCERWARTELKRIALN